MGKGDSKLIAMLGLWLGPLGIILTIAISYISAAIVILIGLVLNKIKLKQTIPFGPFISLGGILVWIFGNDFFLTFEKNNISIFKNNNVDDYFLIKFPKKYLLSETPLILLLWMISSSLILSLIAFLFLRIQIRAIQRLAKSAKDFGEGKKIKKFKPEGALEIRQAGNSFIRMKKKINEYISQRTSFLAGISHDLGTILTRIKLRLELMDNDEHTKSIKKDLKTKKFINLPQEKLFQELLF